MNRKPWTDRDIDVLRAQYPHIPTRDLAVLLDRGIRSVYDNAIKLRLKKTRDFLASGLAGKLDGQRGLSTRFKPGQKPWNAGTSYQAGGRSAESQFKKGHRPHSWRPIGHERITDEGYRQRKIADTGCTRRDYINLHWLLWIEHHGPIPPGMLIIFRDRNPRHISIENLECISRRENMLRNTVHNFPKEIARTIQLLGALNRKINHHRKETHA